MVALLEANVEAARRAFDVSGPDVLVGFLSGIVTLLCVLCHYEMMSWSSRLVPLIRLRRRSRIVALILAMLVAHVVEVWIFGLAYWILDAWPVLGHIDGTFEEGAMDFVYFSVVNFTTLGFGDMVPRGPIRIMCGSEALVGLTLITWSASLAFLEMQRDWLEFRPRR